METYGYDVFCPDSHGPDIVATVVNLLEHCRAQEEGISTGQIPADSSYFRKMRSLGDVVEGLHPADKNELKAALSDLGEVSREYKALLDKAVSLYKRNLASLLNFGSKLRECEKQIKKLELKCS